MDISCIADRNNQADEPEVGIVIIGRNEGDRLVNCLRSISAHKDRIIYVDSGSTDGSVAAAALVCAGVVLLDISIPFTAARARNAGLDALLKIWPDTAFVQFLDGDCELDADWIKTATTFMAAHQQVALVFGRRRERFPNKTIFNSICDREWDGAPGEKTECGGDILVRCQAIADVRGYTDHLIAGEEPEMCIRLRSRGWIIWRLPVEMSIHDANISRFGQWWKRSVRSGHAYAEISALHFRSPFCIWRANLTRTLVWAGLIPIAAIGGIPAHPLSLSLFLAYPLQVLRVAYRMRTDDSRRWKYALFETIGKFAELQGAIQYHANCICGRRQRLIEYK